MIENNTLKPMEIAPKDGTTIHIETVDGKDGTPDYSGPAQWRSEPKSALFCPRTGERYAPAYTLTYWLFPDRPKRIPGHVIGWRDLKSN